MTTPQNIKRIITENQPADAITELDSIMTSISDPRERSIALAEKGKLLWRLDRRGEAISAYEEGAKLDPAGPCSTLLEMSGDIMNFFNKDLLNP